MTIRFKTAPGLLAVAKSAATATLAASVLVIALGATACGSRSKAPDVARFDDKAVGAAGAVVNVLDRDLRSRVGAEIADAQRLPDGRLRIRVNLRNATRKDLNVLVRTVFKDGKSLSVGDETEWDFLYLGPQQIQTYTAESRLADVGTYTVEVRRP